MHKAELASASLSPAGVVSFKPNGTRSDTLDYTAVGRVRIVRNSLQVFAYSAITKRLRDFLGVVAKNRHWLLVLLQIDIAKRSILEVKGFHMIFHMIPLGIDCIFHPPSFFEPGRDGQQDLQDTKLAAPCPNPFGL